MATLQTGTAPNQIPTNGDLGDLAFQSKESVQFTGGRGALSSINLNQIYKEIAATAVDVFVYDTSKDSDGGAWRNRTQHTSWYNETLNTATRGSRREFPSVAVIVATSNAITIYDGDYSDMPMWMVFNEGSGKCLYTNGFSLTAVTALNGILSWAGFRLGVIRFLSDSFSNYEQNFYNYSIKPLSERNGTGTAAYTTSPVILNLYTNDVAMTVLANAPIDAATGLPIPTIAVATAGGVSVIKHDNTVINLLTTSGNQNSISFTASKGLETHGGGGVAFFGWGWYSMPQASTNTSDYLISDNAWSTTNIRRPGSNGNSVLYPMTTTNYGIAIREAAGVSTTDKLILIALTNPAGYSLQSYLTTKYNTGWMPGDIRGAWLSDNTAETMVGSELVTNGTFDSNTSGWLANGSGYHTFSAISGALSVTRGSYGLGGGEPYQAVSVISGKFYRVSFVGASGDMSMTLGSTIGGSQYVSWNSTGASTLREFTFLATTSTVYILFICNSTGTTASIDNVSIRLADPDRSVNNKGLQVFGSITKTPVATGADLVGYSGWTSSNYLKQPPNSALDFGSGSYSVMFWAKASSAGAGIAVGRGPNDSAESICVYLDTTTYGVYFDYGTSAAYVYAPDIKSQVGDGKWHFVVCHVTAGQSGIVWWDSVKQTMQNAGIGVAPATFINNSNWETYIGCGRQPDQPLPYHGSLALVRISATIPTPEQIRKIYEEEKALFQDGAKATLYGASDSVTALAYDEDTRLLHVGTSSGRSVFRGLRRVDNTTTAVGAAISAANGLVAED